MNRTHPFFAVLLVVGLAACGDDADPVAGSSVVSTTAPVPTPAPTTVAPVTDPGTTVVPTTVESTTTSTTQPPVVGWQPADDIPALAYLPCCGSNWTGPPSPPFPADPAAGLAPGIYFAQRIADDVATDSVSFRVARFEPCTELPAGSCEQLDWAPDELGISDFERGFTLPLDDTLPVALSGSTCEPDEQRADGSYLSALMVDFDRAYEQLLGAPFDDGESPEALVSALTDTPSGGFSAPPCEGLGQLVWQGDDGPMLLLQAPFPFDETAGEIRAATRASAALIQLTAIEIAADGSPTLYFFAGFMS